GSTTEAYQICPCLELTVTESLYTSCGPPIAAYERSSSGGSPGGLPSFTTKRCVPSGTMRGTKSHRRSMRTACSVHISRTGYCLPCHETVGQAISGSVT